MHEAGLFLTSHHNLFVSAAHTEEDLAQSFEIFADALKAAKTILSRIELARLNAHSNGRGFRFWNDFPDRNAFTVGCLTRLGVVLR